MTTKTTRYLGTCPACERTIKVRDSLLVHHGYQRPGHGYIEGDCFGVGREPHELSNTTARAYRAEIEKRVQMFQGSLEGLPGRWTLTDDLMSFSGRPPAVIARGEFGWDALYSRIEYKLKASLEAASREARRLDGLIEGWTLLPLKAVDEEVAAKRAAKEEREAAKAAKRAVKVEAAVASLQKRIDSAVRSRNSSTLADLWRSGVRKVRDIDGSLTVEQALQVIDRPAVWEAFGLSADLDNKATLERMKSRMHRIEGTARQITLNASDDGWSRKVLTRMTLEWPESLGGENTKGAATLADLLARLNG